jgi:hypothetical protein
MASIAAKANTPATYFAPVRASRGMAASSHVRHPRALCRQNAESAAPKISKAEVDTW